MTNDENESANIKAEHPLTPQQDNRIFESIPVRPAPWSKQSEAGSAMNRERALGMFRAANQWLYERISEGATCDCGNCYLCAYNFFALAPASPAAPSPFGYERALSSDWEMHNARRHELIEAARARSLSEPELAELAELQWLAGIKRELANGPVALRDEAVSLNVDVDEQGEIVFGPTTPPSTLAKAAAEEILSLQGVASESGRRHHRALFIR